MVRWDADKNAYITGAVLAELKMTISNQVVQAVLDAWPTSTLGEAPTPRALKDQVKKLSSTSAALGSSSTTTAVKKAGPKATAAAGKKVAIAGKKGAGKGKKRGRQHDEEDEDGEKEINDEANKQGPAKKIKKEIIEYEDGNDDEDAEA
ncbi:hypothetical protein VTO58DRAFT_103877 [Aureobasidium pullulans]|nr:hypothetical protein JADG_009695 [Aureobasidium pullulans]